MIEWSIAKSFAIREKQNVLVNKACRGLCKTFYKINKTLLTKPIENDYVNEK